MDKSARMTYKMIELAIDKGLRDMQENTGRGLRNLVDMGAHLSKSRFHQDFFHLAQQTLADKNSPYYELTSNVIQHVDLQILKHAAIKLDYTCWSYGARKIRKFEERHGYIVPWTIVFDFRQEANNTLAEAEVDELLNHGESMGIFCGMFFMNDNQLHLAALLEKLAHHKEGIYFVFAEPGAITQAVAESAVRSKNIVLVLNLKTLDCTPSFNKAAELLFQNKCLYGAYSEYNDQNINLLISDRYLSQIKTTNCSVFFMIGKNLNEAENINLFTKFMKTVKIANQYPFFIIDFYKELAYVNHTISSEDCFIAIRGDGQAVVKTMDNFPSGFNVRMHSLPVIMENTMPKT